MRIKILIGVLILFVCSLSLKAQSKQGSFDVEKHHREQAEFFTKELELTAKETEDFIPLMQEYIHARFELNKEIRSASRTLRRKENRTSEDYQKVIDLMLDSRIKEAELQKEYFQKFGKILPPEKVLKYHLAEMKFMERVVKKHKQGSRKTNKDE